MYVVRLFFNLALLAFCISNNSASWFSSSIESRRVDRPEDYAIKTVFYTAELRDRINAERNLEFFERENKDKIDRLRELQFFDIVPGSTDDKVLTEITNIIYRIVASRTNLTMDLRLTPKEFLRDLDSYSSIIWNENEDDPYVPQSGLYGTLDALKQSVSDLVKIINFAQGDWSSDESN